jgi:hypothetical protein
LSRRGNRMGDAMAGGSFTQAAQADRQRQGKVLVSVLRRARASSRPNDAGRLALENGCRRVRSGPLALCPSIGYCLTEGTYKTALRVASKASGWEAGPHTSHRPSARRQGNSRRSRAVVSRELAEHTQR